MEVLKFLLPHLDSFAEHPALTAMVLYGAGAVGRLTQVVRGERVIPDSKTFEVISFALLGWLEGLGFMAWSVNMGISSLFMLKQVEQEELAVAQRRVRLK